MRSSVEVAVMRVARREAGSRHVRAARRGLGRGRGRRATGAGARTAWGARQLARWRRRAPPGPAPTRRRFFLRRGAERAGVERLVLGNGTRRVSRTLRVVCSPRSALRARRRARVARRRDASRASCVSPAAFACWPPRMSTSSTEKDGGGSAMSLPPATACCASARLRRRRALPPSRSAEIQGSRRTPGPRATRGRAWRRRGRRGS